MPPVIHHRCKYMVRDCNTPKGSTNGYVYEHREGIWRLQNFAEMMKEGCRRCDWCGLEFHNLEHASISKERSHRCLKMARVEMRRNEENAHHKGDRSYVIQWLPATAWTLLNNGKTTKRVELSECPFCHKAFPFLNQVCIE